MGHGHGHGHGRVQPAADAERSDDPDQGQDLIFVIGPAGSISSTAPDMAKFMIAHLQNGTYGNATILSEQTAGLMHARAFTNDPRMAGMCLGFYEQLYNGRRTIGHGGDTNTFHSLLILIPEEQTGFFVSSNSDGGRGVRNELFTSFMDHYYPQEPQVLPQPDPSASAQLQKYAGTYTMNRHNYARVDKFLNAPTPIEFIATADGTLIEMTRKGPVELIEKSPGVFSRTDMTRPAEGDFVFHTTADGTVDYCCNENYPFMVFDRVPWYATPDFVERIKIIAGIILASVLLWPLLFIFRRIYAIPEPSVPKPAVIGRWLAGSAAILLLVFAFVLIPACDQAIDPVLPGYCADVTTTHNHERGVSGQTALSTVSRRDGVSTGHLETSKIRS